MKKPSPKTVNRLLLTLGVLLIAAAVVIFAATGGHGYTVTTFSMGSYVQQTVYGAHREEAAASAADAVQSLENLLSWRVEDSDIFRLNQHAGQDFIPIEEQTAEVLRTALSVCEASGGALDITIAPISRLWDFDENPHVPEAGQIQRFLPQVDFTTLGILDDGTAALRKLNTALDLGAVGKGAACDAAVAAYGESGASRGIVAVGGSVGIYGQKPFGQPWVIAVRDPAGSGALGELRLRSGFISTSGSYEKSFVEDGKTYHHLLDPATGYPAESGLVSVTVVSDGGALSDALSTACFVLGAEKSLPVLAAFDAQAVFVTEDGRVLVTAGLEEAFTLTADGYAREALA